jgi:SAM-dependent methyltransferase
LGEIQTGARPATVLCDVEPKVLQIRCSKAYDEKPSKELLRAVPEEAQTILSIGCGFGATEVELQARGARVTAFPLDSVVGASVGRLGIEVIPGSLDECLRAVGGRRFDCVLMTNLVHLLPEAMTALRRCSLVVEPGGTMVIEGRNFDHLPTLIKRLAGVGDYRRIRRFDEGGIHALGPTAISTVLRGAGFEVSSLAWRDHGWPWPLASLARYSGRLGARTWIVGAERRRSPEHVEDLAFGQAVQR